MGHGDHTSVGPEALLTPQLVDLQRVAGNSAVSQLLQRQAVPPTPATKPGPQPTPGTKPGTIPTGATPAAAPTPAATPAADPLSDTRIKWIEGLPAQIRASIDGAGDGVEDRVRKVEGDIAKQRAALDAAKTDPDKKAASDAITKLLAERDKKTTSWAPKRLALLGYLGCQLGGDVGVERYFKSLVNWTGGLWVHPEAARRLTRVRDELLKEGIQMPTTDNGFALRGRHVHGKKESESPGMMTHALGVAIDWEAYKNVHIKDEQLMHLITAVTGTAHHLELPSDAVATIRALGERSMGNAPATDAKAVAKGDAMIATVGTEFDRVEAASDMFRDSLTFKKEDLMALHRELVTIGQPLRKAREDLKEAPGNKNLIARIKQLEEASVKKMAENKVKLETLFKPWLDALKKAADGARKEAEGLMKDPQLKGKKLEDVLTDIGLQSRAAGVKGLTGVVAKDLGALVNVTNGTINKAQTIRSNVAGARAYLDKSGSDQDKAAWTDRLAKLEERAAAVVGRGAAVTSESSVLRGGAPTKPAAAPNSKPRKTKWDKEVPAWEAEIGKHETAVGTSEATLTTTTGKVPKKDVAEAYKLRDDRAASEEIRTRVTKDQWSQLQDLKAKLWNLEQATYRLRNDASFMFGDASARDPGVAQLTGPLEENESHSRSDIGGGGFFGTAKSAKEAAAKVEAKDAEEAAKRAAKGLPVDPAKKKTPLPPRAGFSKRFFQVMVKYGFEPAARWREADSMHFQVAGLAADIVPTKECIEPPADAEGKAKTDDEKAKIAALRAAAAGARTRGEDYSKAAETANKAWTGEAH